MTEHLRIDVLVPDEAVEAANAALARERRLPPASMRAAILAALPLLPALSSHARDELSREPEDDANGT